MNDERETPRWLFDKLNAAFGFTVDLAATSDNTLVKDRFYSKADDGLSHSWCNEVAWCNPPYSRGQQIKWINKAISECTNSHCMIVMLLPSDNSTKAVQLALENAVRILFLNKRLKFNGPKEEKSSAKFANIIAVFDYSYLATPIRYFHRANRLKWITDSLKKLGLGAVR